MPARSQNAVEALKVAEERLKIAEAEVETLRREVFLLMNLSNSALAELRALAGTVGRGVAHVEQEATIVASRVRPLKMEVPDPPAESPGLGVNGGSNGGKKPG